MRALAERTLAVEDWRRRVVFWGGAVAVGAVAVLFAKASDLVMSWFTALRHRYVWWPFLVTPAGLALCAWLTERVFVGAEGSGIPQLIAALAVPTEQARSRLLSMRIAIGKILLTLIALYGGASIGREGPTVQVSASIMHSLRRFARFPAADLDRGLILAGGAAGVAAAFNTPLAGVVFAIEELWRAFDPRTSARILLAVIVAGITSLALVGNYTYFGTTNAIMTDPHMWLSVFVCGVVGGLCGGVFSRAMVSCGRALPVPLQEFRSERPVAFAAVCGVVLAVLGLLSHATTYGTGYGEARALLENENLSSHGFALWKALATLVSYVSGIPGGIFAPSLAIGAGIGASLHSAWPLAPIGAMVFLSMAAYFAGVVQAPLTALVIVTEMTGNRGLTLPLMAAVFLGRGASALVCRTSLYHSLAEKFLPKPESEADFPITPVAPAAPAAPVASVAPPVVPPVEPPLRP
jgi:H+/Cl- antiporter ClcA